MNVEIVIPPDVIETIAMRAAEIAVERIGVPSPASEPSPYFTVEEAATFLRCSRSRVDDLLSQRKLTRVKDGRRTLVVRAEVETYLRRETRRRGR